MLRKFALVGFIVLVIGIAGFAVMAAQGRTGVHRLRQNEGLQQHIVS